MNVRRSMALFCVASFLAGCAGARQGVSPLPPSDETVAASSAHAMSQNAASRHREKGTLTVRIRIPRRHNPARPGKAPRYISAATKSMTLAFSGPSTFTQVVNLTPSDPRCTGSPLTCSIAVTLLAGNYTVTIDTYDKTPVSGSIPANANLLSTAKNAPFTMTGGITNSIGIALDGVPASLVVSGLPNAAIGTALSPAQPFSVTAKDADGNIITGTYDEPVTLSNGDTSGATGIVTSGSDNPPPGKLLSSSDITLLTYTGSPIVSATIGASATGATAGSAIFAPTPVLTSIDLTNAAGTSETDALIGAETLLTLHGNFATTPGATPTTINLVATGATLSDVTIVSATQMTAVLFLDPHTASAGSIGVTVQTSAGATSPAVNVTSSSTHVDVVTLDTDSSAGAPPGTGAGTAGDLRHAILNASAGDTIVFDTTSMCGASLCSITLNGPLPPITHSLSIDGGLVMSGTPRVTIDGHSLYRAVFVDTGTVLLHALMIQNARANGGNGGSGTSGGGGGAGVGAGLFVNGVVGAAAVTVADCAFSGNGAVGGTGGSYVVSQGAAGGGGLGASGGNGGLNGSSTFTDGGGGGVLGVGAAGTTIGTNGSSGGLGGGGGSDANGDSTASGGTGGAGYAGDAAGANGNLAGAGAGGFGGGGGGSVGGASAGAGGFGGGGGGAEAAGGSGGPGGGGGAGLIVSSGLGGPLSGTLKGGAGDPGLHGDAGGGAAAGPDIFVNQGIVTTTDSDSSGATASGGAGGTGNGGSGGAGGADATPVFNYGGTVNGSSTTGPIAGALGSGQPSARRKPHRRKSR